MISESEHQGHAAYALARLGLALPTPTTPSAQYVPVTKANGIIFVSGQLPRDDNGKVIAAAY